MIVIALLAARLAAAGEPVRVAIECESEGRTKACPAFLLGFVDANKTLLQAPRAAADVVIYASAAEVALVDRVHLRYVATLAGAPPVIEIDVDVDTRADDDTQRAQLEPAFLRGIALYVAARFPHAVTVTIEEPETEQVVAPRTSPWDAGVHFGGWGNRTESFRSYNASASTDAAYLARQARIAAELEVTAGYDQKPDLVLDDGTHVPIRSTQWQLSAAVDGAYLLDDTWSVGGSTAVLRDDPLGQYRYRSTTRAGIEWDAFPADEPRGNRLAVLYVAGYEVDGYRLRDDLGETSAAYAIHELIASGSVRKDQVSFGIALTVSAQMFDPGRRHSLSAAPFVQWMLGGHVDLDVTFSITKRALPGPDPALIDETDYAQLSRLSYAEPLAMTGTFNISIHGDRTNGARNDRFTDL